MADSEGCLLTLTCAERPGIVHAISDFLVERGCDIIDNRQYGDRESGRFFMRVHFTTADAAVTLDALGPIIEQEVIRVDHTLSPEELVAVGRDTESLAPAHAVQWHVERRVLLNGTRTVVFH